MALFTTHPFNGALSPTGGRRLTVAAQLEAQKQELVATWWLRNEENIQNLSRFLLERCLLLIKWQP